MQTAFRSDERFTQAGFWEWIEERTASDINRYELLGGRIIMTPPANFPHSALAVRIIVPLQNYSEATGGLVQESSAGFDFPSGDTLAPDVTFISASRLATGPRPEQGGPVKIVPDLVVEVLSPSTARRDRTEKKKVYEHCGVEEYWLVDPRRREVAILQREGDRFGTLRVTRTGPIVSRVAAGLDLTIEKLFANLG